MDSFIAVLSATRQGERLAVQLALCSPFRTEFEALPVQSAGWKVCCLLLDHCIEGLGRIWKQTEAVAPGYPGIQNFLRSTKQSMVLEGFDDRNDEARNFRDQLQRSYRVTAKAGGPVNKLRLEIIKVLDEAWQAECSKDWFHYDDRQEKLDTLGALRKDQPIWEPLMPSAFNTRRPT